MVFQMIGSYFYVLKWWLSTHMLLSCILHDNQFSQNSTVPKTNFHRDWMTVKADAWLDPFCNCHCCQWIFVTKKITEKEDIFGYLFLTYILCRFVELCICLSETNILCFFTSSVEIQRGEYSPCGLIMGTLLSKSPWEHPWLMSLTPTNRAIWCQCAGKVKHPG